ncbi:CC0125/CC1285 family lipoprotein [Rheinheimera oceanensis]|uniref:CC0125/CC1285 family lipoprotein n=1 Tax=Rheinheimera oceanensis TaxID=2817449 RepID=UPI001BFE4002|nr:hypothetical protein [Rheinheimera oceanensis]
MTQQKFIPTLILLGLVLLSSCSSQPDYRAANGRGYGYSEQQISNNYYRVTFKSAGADSGKAKAYALRRAAELAEAQGYDWFAVVEKETLVERQQDNSNHVGAGYQHTTVQDCSLPGCRSRTVTRPQYEIGISSGGRNQVEAVLEIRMGKGVMPDSSRVYPAGSGL